MLAKLHGARFDSWLRRSRSKIADIGTPTYKLLATDSRKRGLAAIGLELENPAAIELESVATGATVVRAHEERDGSTLGELEIEVFKAALLIDRDGILEQKAHLAVCGHPAPPLGGAARSGEAGPCEAERGRVRPPVRVTLAGGSGFRAEIVRMTAPGAARPGLPYTSVFALAPDDLSADGGVLITVRSASPEWPAADAIVRTIKVLGRRNATANDTEALGLPMIGDREDK